MKKTKDATPEPVEDDSLEKKAEDNITPTGDSLQSLIEKNIKWSQVIYEQNRKIKRRLTMMAVGNYVRLALIIAPIILAVVYLPSLIEKWFGAYSQLLGGAGGGTPGAGLGLPLQDILSQIKPEQIQALLKSLPQQ